jgi:LMBR1 domain-containing protein 1
LNTPFFGLIFYYSQWAFLVSFGLGFLISLFRSPNNHQHHHHGDEEHQQHHEDDEQAGLLDGRHH